MANANPDKEQLMGAILSRAATDPTFRSGLLTHPKTTISGAFGVAIPDAFRVRFIEKDPDLDALVVLPDLRDPKAELTDSDLEAVRGGGGPGYDPFGIASWSE